ncbi:MAG: T9SS type A sorting domain-containing protein [Bacteroidetes bacterium]|nr:T9SS type A sorting domain-containing protein [Bacteroidota bacterium]
MKDFSSVFFAVFYVGIGFSFSQSRIVISDDAYMVVSNSACVVLENSSTNALSTAGTGGNIISEAESNRIKWNIGTSTGTYTIPFTKSAGNKIPLIFDITSAGVGSGNVVFSTYAGPDWDNLTYKPGDVANMIAVCCANNSANVIDRFWIIDTAGYTTNPTATITFTYLDGEWSAAGNSITESALFAQRYNTGIPGWADWYGSFLTANTGSNTVSSGSVTPSNLFRSWTLVDQDSPLPIELLHFNVTCKGGDELSFTWSTASETNNSYFTLEGRDDAKGWINMGQVAGAGNSTSLIKYNKTVKNKYACKYFRLKQTDFDGKYEYSTIVAKNCDRDGFTGTGNGTLLTFPNPSNAGESIYVQLSGLVSKAQVLVVLMDVIGQTVYSKVTLSDSSGGVLEAVDHTLQLAPGVYTVIGLTQNAIYNKKIIIR